MYAYAVWDEFPCVEGHTLIIPRSHTQSIFDLKQSWYHGVWTFVDTVRQVLMEKFPGVVDFNIGINDGYFAGQTIHHAHIHLFPRREGDMADPRFGVRMMFGEKGPYKR
jgi:ATP adenylyltransferase